MSSLYQGVLHRKAAALLLLTLVCLSAPAQCQDGSEWDRARAALIVSQPTAMAQAIGRWQILTASDGYGFSDYAGFVLAYPGFPEEMKLRLAAEKALSLGVVEPAQIIAFFDRFPPLTNPARAQYALALTALGRPEAAETARAAWRGGTMSATAELTIMQDYGARFTTDDYDARSDALLWDGNSVQATNILDRLSARARAIAQARLALIIGSASTSTATPGSDGSIVTGGSLGGTSYPSAASYSSGSSYLGDPGYIYTRARLLIQSHQTSAAADLLASRAAFTRLPLDQRKWIDLQLAAARGADTSNAVRIAERADEAFAPGTDLSQLSFSIRDDYTSLTWLGGTQALWILHDPARAATLFYRYGAAGRTPQTRAKGFYWAGRALAQADSDKSNRYFKSAAAFPDQFYGMLALERLGRPLPSLIDPPHPAPTAAQRAAFYARPITQAVREVARPIGPEGGADWQTTIRFFREISTQAVTEADRSLVAELARTLGRRDLGVVLGQAASNDEVSSFRDVSFPLIPVPPEADWTMVHAISRQESQFSQNALSRTGARGLMQLMPGTAEDEANKLGLGYSLSRLTSDPAYNMELGDAVFSHLMTVYGGCYPLAIAAYNSGPGNVNKWLRDIGDPRLGSVNWIDWIERIPFSETRGYVAHVIENAVVYEALYPQHARYRGPNPASHFLTKRTPG
ncbi:MAG: lytic transglycosylase domain-containing protein [Pseudomonadota bacterium]|nr:lytic transglycosylase domain-containing protein [Pseudomonadota bacterium]